MIGNTLDNISEGYYLLTNGGNDEIFFFYCIYSDIVQSPYNTKIGAYGASARIPLIGVFNITNSKYSTFTVYCVRWN